MLQPSTSVKAGLFLNIVLLPVDGSITEKGDLFQPAMGQKGGSRVQNTRKTFTGSGSRGLLHHYSKGGNGEPIYFGKRQSLTHPGPPRTASYILLLITVEIIPLSLLFAHIPRSHDVSVSFTTRRSEDAVRPDRGAEGVAHSSAGNSSVGRSPSLFSYVFIATSNGSLEPVNT